MSVSHAKFLFCFFKCPWNSILSGNNGLPIWSALFWPMNLIFFSLFPFTMFPVFYLVSALFELDSSSPPTKRWETMCENRNLFLFLSMYCFTTWFTTKKIKISPNFFNRSPLFPNKVFSGVVKCFFVCCYLWLWSQFIISWLGHKRFLYSLFI